MSSFTKENKRTDIVAIMGAYSKNLTTLSKILQEAKENKRIEEDSVEKLCLFISNYTSSLKSIFTKYLQLSGMTNMKIDNMSTAELISNFKKQVYKDTLVPCRVDTAMQLIVFKLRNTLSHTCDQSEYLERVIDSSGNKKFINFLTKIGTEAIEIKALLENKLYNENLKKEVSEQIESSVKSEEQHYLGIRL